jgi:hypothetical protein
VFRLQLLVLSFVTIASEDLYWHLYLYLCLYMYLYLHPYLYLYLYMSISQRATKATTVWIQKNLKQKENIAIARRSTMYSKCSIILSAGGSEIWSALSHAIHPPDKLYNEGHCTKCKFENGKCLDNFFCEPTKTFHIYNCTIYIRKQRIFFASPLELQNSGCIKLLCMYFGSHMDCSF